MLILFSDFQMCFSKERKKIKWQKKKVHNVGVHINRNKFTVTCWKPSLIDELLVTQFYKLCFSCRRCQTVYWPPSNGLPRCWIRTHWACWPSSCLQILQPEDKKTFYRRRLQGIFPRYYRVGVTTGFRSHIWKIWNPGTQNHDILYLVYWLILSCDRESSQTATWLDVETQRCSLESKPNSKTENRREPEVYDPHLSRWSNLGHQMGLSCGQRETI